ncbi:hypothetical protein SDC9_34602 [bioreactor metagenome]|uniref:Uncharacterized protein n=1 Tax=bioreactor metagenome TaxID=1076179 RepID=A0A644VB46_9ZZZZ
MTPPHGASPKQEEGGAAPLFAFSKFTPRDISGNWKREGRLHPGPVPGVSGVLVLIGGIGVGLCDAQHRIAQHRRDQRARKHPHAHRVHLVVGLEVQRADEERHGEADAGEAGNAVELHPGGGGGQAGDAQLDHRPGRAEDAELLAEHERERDAERQRLEQIADAHAREVHPGVRIGEDRHDQEHHVRVQRVFERMRGRFAVAVLERDEEGGDDTRERGVHARFQHQHPKHGAEDQRRRQPVATGQVAQQHQRDRDQREQQIMRLQMLGVEDRDHQDSAEVVENGEGEQEDLQPRRHPGAKECDDADGKGDVGRGRDRPGLGVRGVAPVEGEEDQRRGEHAAKRRHPGQHHIRGLLQPALDDLALQFEPDEQEEHRHQPVVDPQDQRFRQPVIAKQDGELRIQHVGVERRQARVRGQEGEHRRQHQHDAACRLVLK